MEGAPGAAPSDPENKAPDSELTEPPAKAPLSKAARRKARKREANTRRASANEGEASASSGKRAKPDEREPIPRKKRQRTDTAKGTPPDSEEGEARRHSSGNPPAEGDTPSDQKRPRPYGYWMADRNEWKAKPWALVLFSGRSRSGDLQHELSDRGWLVCAIDILCPTKTNILDEAVWSGVIADIQEGKFAAMWMATPCETFSPLREKQPGPRPLRSAARVGGLPRSRLSQAEQKQLREANILVSRTAAAAQAQSKAGGVWGLENPTHPGDRPELWKMPEIEQLWKLGGVKSYRFDQCRYGCETAKPTIFLTQGLDFGHLEGKKCNHPKKTWTRPDGSTYEAAHESPVQRWREGAQGRERASKALGEYPSELSSAIAQAVHQTQGQAKWLARELEQEEL